MTRIWKRKVFVAMSGGVDSSVAALLLKRQGYDAVGVFMRCWSEESSDACGVGADCTAEADATDARRAAEHIGIPFYVWDFEEEYKRKVVDYMIRGYKTGLTPNPDVMCNKEIKFGLFFKRAREMGADYVSTGHYVRLRQFAFRNRGSISSSEKLPAASRSDGSPKATPSPSGLRELPQDKLSSRTFSLGIAKDTNKDQSYFLWTLTQDQIAHSLFPIGEYLKPEVREIARRAGLPTFDKKDSQGICFLGKIDVADFLKQHIPVKTGDLVTVGGERIGTHDGAYFYTIGQRHLGAGIRLEVGGVRKNGGNPKPYYVSGKSVKMNTITVAEGKNNPALYQTKVELGEVNFIDPAIPSLIRANKKIRVMARVRYRQPLSEAMLRKSEIRSQKSETFELIFEKPQRFVAPGQSAVFYLSAGAQGAKEGASDPSARSGRRSVELRMLGGGVIQ